MKNERQIKYYSTLLDKTFDTVEELEKEEDKHLEVKKAEEEKLEVKKDLAKQVEEAYKHYMQVTEETAKKFVEVQKQLNEERKTAEKEYLKLRDEFIEKYGQFHMTYKNNEPKVDVEEKQELTTYDVVNSIFDAFKNWPFF